MNKKVITVHNLANIKPSLAKEWHPKKNKSLTPRDITPNSGRKVWWLCKKGHEWLDTVSHRNIGRGCPYCSGRRPCNDNCLATVNPSVAKEWHPNKNRPLTPRDVTPNSNKKVWWLCKKGHEWKTIIAQRNTGGSCPYCIGRRVCNDNCLATVNPSLAKEWHPKKNKSLTPRDITPNSGRKVWWLCRRGHEWKAIIANRNKGRGCPYCHSTTSSLELRIYAELKYLFNNIKHRVKIKGVECDIYIPKFKFGIEVDGFYWHNKKYLFDRKKTAHLKKEGIFLLRLREEGLKKVSINDIVFRSKNIDVNIIKKILKILIKNIKFSNKTEIKKIRAYIKRHNFANENEWKKMLYMLPSPIPEYSLANINPSVAKEWHPNKNRPLTPRDVTSKSHQKVWWLCRRGHEWFARVSHRSGGSGCPYCSGNLAYGSNCLRVINPSVAKEWHPNKNKSLTPRDVTPNSDKKVWWLCKKGHEWLDTVSHRNLGRGCPYCSGRRACNDNCLATVNPSLAKDWHPKKNKSLTPQDVTPHSNKKVWWLCKRGHGWEASVNGRTRGNGCPYCSGRRACNDNCLATVNPSLAKEWHPNKNKSLTPRDITPNSGRKVWWLCKKGHEWFARVAHRNKGIGCPYCSGNLAYSSNCLRVINPSLAKEWHPNKNKSLTPRDVTPHSNKKVWWLCKKGHKWEASVSDRTRGNGCPYCSGRRACNDNCLATVNPSLAKEWHPKKNKSLTPRNVTSGSDKKVWWLCKKGHEWLDTVSHRNLGRGCPYCSARRKRILRPR